MLKAKVHKKKFLLCKILTVGIYCQQSMNEGLCKEMLFFLILKCQFHLIKMESFFNTKIQSHPGWCKNNCNFLFFFNL